MPIIDSPTPGLPEFHLLVASHGPSTESRVFIPLSDRPGLTRDILRVDRLPRSRTPLAAILQHWLAAYAALFEVPQLMYKADVTREDEFLIYAGFSRHPIVGAHHTHMRYLRRSDGDYSIEFIRKIDPLSEDEIARRFAFLRTWAEFSDLVGSRTTTLTPFAAAAVAQSKRNHELMVEAERRKQLRSMPAADVRESLVRASPLHDVQLWANLARFYGRNVLDEGLIEEFDTATDCMKAALVFVHDVRGDAFFYRLIHDLAENLAELLMCTYGEARAANVARAVELYQTLASVWKDLEPKRALNADVMAAFGLLVLEPDSLTPFANRLSGLGRAALQQQERALEIFEFLIGYASRLAYIARRKGRPLYEAACLAADIAQVVAEGLYVPDEDLQKAMGRVVQAVQAQLDSQLGLWGLTQQDLDRDVAAFVAKFRQPGQQPLRLLLLRPLSTSRRIKLENRFGAYYDDVRWPTLPGTLTLESALHVAFAKRFNAEALGGPIDLFGMQRLTALGVFSSTVKSWQATASILMQHASVVLAVFDEREALYWEMSELARLRAFGRLIFVVPPTSREPADDSYSTAAVSRLRELGLELPERVPQSGFILFEESGAVERILPFESLWSGELLEIVSTRKPMLPIEAQLDLLGPAGTRSSTGDGLPPVLMQIQGGFDTSGQSMPGGVPATNG